MTGAAVVGSNGNLAAAADGWVVFPQPSKHASSAEGEQEASSKMSAEADTGEHSKAIRLAACCAIGLGMAEAGDPSYCAGVGSGLALLRRHATRN